MLSGLRGGLKIPKTRRQGNIAELPDFGHVLRYKALPVSRFNGSNTYVHLRSLDAAVSILAVWRKTTATFSDFNGLITCRVAPNGNKTGNSDENIYFGGVSGQNSLTSAGTVLSVRHNGIDLQGTDLTNYQNPVVGYNIGAATGWHYTWQSQSSAANTKNWCIGADTLNAVGTRQLTGEITEILIYPRVLSLGQILEVEDYVKSYISTL